MSRRQVAKNTFRPDVHVQPAPTLDEAAAIVAALRMLHRERRANTATSETVSPWRVAARNEGLRSDLSHGRDGWRLNARLEQ